jgi:hypothetical protein
MRERESHAWLSIRCIRALDQFWRSDCKQEPAVEQVEVDAAMPLALEDLEPSRSGFPPGRCSLARDPVIKTGKELHTPKYRARIAASLKVAKNHNVGPFSVNLVLRGPIFSIPMKPTLSNPSCVFSEGIWAEGQGGTHEDQRGVVSLKLSPDSRQ